MLVGGFFGMNTKSGLEESQYAWLVTVFLCLVAMVVTMGWFTRVMIPTDTNNSELTNSENCPLNDTVKTLLTCKMLVCEGDKDKNTSNIFPC